MFREKQTAATTIKISTLKNSIRLIIDMHRHAPTSPCFCYIAFVKRSTATLNFAPTRTIAMKAEKWDIVPYTRVGKPKFGLGKDADRNILGKEWVRDYDEIENETRLCWKEGIHLFFDADGLSMIGFYPDMQNIIINDTPLNWNNTISIFNDLLKKDHSAMECLGSFIFFEHGIIVKDFDSKEKYEKSIAAFRKGVWLRDDPLLQPVR